jgi:hypothetical protein
VTKTPLAEDDSKWVRETETLAYAHHRRYCYSHFEPLEAGTVGLQLDVPSFLVDIDIEAVSEDLSFKCGDPRLTLDEQVLRIYSVKISDLLANLDIGRIFHTFGLLLTLKPWLNSAALASILGKDQLRHTVFTVHLAKQGTFFLDMAWLGSCRSAWLSLGRMIPHLAVCYIYEVTVDAQRVNLP